MKMKTGILLWSILAVLCTLGSSPINAQTRPAGKYPETSTRRLTPADLQGKSIEELKIMRNEIFARHGYKFKTKEMRRYFSRQKWYRPEHDDIAGRLSAIEAKNAKMIKAYETKLGQGKKSTKIRDIIEKQKRERVFEAAWGSGPTELGMIIGQEAASEGPASFTIDDSGRIFVLDQVNERIQVYGRSGKHEKSIPIPTRLASDIALGQSGNPILLDKYRAKAVFFIDAKGKIQKKVDLVGKGIASTESVWTIDSRPEGVWVECDTNLVRICDPSGKPEEDRPMLTGKLSLDGRHLLSYRKLGDITALVTRRPVGKSGGANFHLYFDIPVYHSTLLNTDKPGNIYIGMYLCEENRDKGPPYSIEDEHEIVVILDKNGREKQRLYMPVSSYLDDVTRSVRLTPDGTIYQLVADQDKATLWRYHP